MKEEKFKVKNLYFGDLVMLLDRDSLTKLPTKVEELESDILYENFYVSIYNLNDGIYYPKHAVYDVGDFAIRGYDLCLDRFVSQNKITRAELETVQKEIVNSNKYQKIKALKKQAYIKKYPGEYS